MPFSYPLGTWLFTNVFWRTGVPELPPFELALHDPLGNELTGQPGYTRVELPSTAWGSTVNGVFANTSEISFPIATGDWTQTVSGWSLWTKNSEPLIDILMKDTLDDSYTIMAGEAPTFHTGAIQIALDRDFSDYAEVKLMDRLFRKTVYDPPNEIWVGLSRAAPGEDGSGLDEPSAGGYSRVRTLPGDWALPAGGDAYNLITITFPKATLPWGTVTHFALFDSGGYGHMFLSGLLYPEREVGVGSVPRFEPTTEEVMGIDMAFMPDW